MGRRQFSLLAKDEKFLEEYKLPWETLLDGSQWVLIHQFPTHDGYNEKTVVVAVRLETGYPATELNMVYVHPALSRTDGKPIKATQATQQIDGKTFQRWSRHRTAANPWKPNEDSLETHVILIEDWFEREFL